MKQFFVRRLQMAPALTLFLVGCASTPLPPDPILPPALRPPEGQVLSQVLNAQGVQIYECTASTERPGTYDWSFKAPEASLSDAVTGRAMGRHYAGPSWEAPDGSIVVGKVSARDDGPDPRAIPWLLLTAEVKGREGIFSKVRSIQRLRTEGGKPPAQGCDSQHAGEISRMPYKAEYRFYTSLQ